MLQGRMDGRTQLKTGSFMCSDFLLILFLRNTLINRKKIFIFKQDEQKMIKMFIEPFLLNSKDVASSPHIFIHQKLIFHLLVPLRAKFIMLQVVFTNKSDLISHDSIPSSFAN